MLAIAKLSNSAGKRKKSSNLKRDRRENAKRVPQTVSQGKDIYIILNGIQFYDSFGRR